MRLWGLFSGTKSVGVVARAMGIEVVSLDISPKYQPDFIADILDFGVSIWPNGWFEVIWARPPCTLYSVASNNPKPTEGNTATRRCLEVIEYLAPKYNKI